jgi:methylmalonyl-CoA mutase N-terminal domain/subunit
MFTNDTIEKEKKLQKKWQEKYSKFYKDKEVKATTASGIPVKPYYMASDIEHIDCSEIGAPGEYPYTRGIYPLQYQFQPWVNQMSLGYGLPEQTRERMEMLKDAGMKGYFGSQSYNLPHDLVSKAGLDPDSPEARGLVGRGGVNISTIEDIDRLFHDLPLDKTQIVQNIGSATMVGLAMFIVYAESRGVSKEKLGGNSMNWLYKAPFVDYAMFPPKNAFKLMVEFIKFCSRNMPRWNTTNICGYFIEEAGGNAIQEAAFSIATGIAITEECIKAGLDPDEFLPRFGFQFAQGNDFLEEIAKIRAIRKLWAKTNKERFGCKNPKSMQVRMHIHTSGCSLMAQQPLTNVVRAAFHTLGAVLAGTNALHTSAYDEALGLPTEEAATLALRTQQVVLHETHIPNVSDPLAGSYYMEWLTHKIEDEANKLIKKIDEMGYIKAWETGWFKEELADSAYKWRETMDNKERIVVGVNKYESGEQQKVPVFKIDPKIEETAVERVRQFRAKRDNAKTEKALGSLRDVAKRMNEEWPNGGNLMPALIEAARADATLGEMQGVLKEVFGWGYAY